MLSRLQILPNRKKKIILLFIILNRYLGSFIIMAPEIM